MLRARLEQEVSLALYLPQKPHPGPAALAGAVAMGTGSALKPSMCQYRDGGICNP